MATTRRVLAIVALQLAGSCVAQGQETSNGFTCEEGFVNVATLSARGWILQNNSEALGSGRWGQGDPDLFAACSGVAAVLIARRRDQPAVTWADSKQHCWTSIQASHQTATRSTGPHTGLHLVTACPSSGTDASHSTTTFSPNLMARTARPLGSIPCRSLEQLDVHLTSFSRTGSSEHDVTIESFMQLGITALTILAECVCSIACVTQK